MATNRNHLSQALAHKRRGRKQGVKTVSDVVEQHRRAWLCQVTKEKGKNIELCRLLQVPDSFVSHLTAGRRTFTNAIVERIETVLKLPHGTIDSGLVVTRKDDSAVSIPSTSEPAHATATLEPGLAVALTNLLSQALAQGKVNNASAVKLIGELVSINV